MHDACPLIRYAFIMIENLLYARRLANSPLCVLTHRVRTPPRRVPDRHAKKRPHTVRCEGVAYLERVVHFNGEVVPLFDDESVIALCLFYG